MNTGKVISGLLAGRGKNFDAMQVLKNYDKAIAAISNRKLLLDAHRKRKYYRKTNAMAGCKHDNITRGLEPAFSRALYNVKYFSLDGELAIMLDYEVPLSAGTNLQKVDVLAYKPASGTFVAIEYKSKPFGTATGVEYALLESYCYWKLLERYLSSSAAIHRELTKYLCERKSDLGLIECIQTPTAYKAEFYVAGPVSYFDEFVKIKKGIKQQERIQRIADIELAIRNTTNAFRGYLLLSEISHHRHAVAYSPSGNNISYPQMIASIPDLVGMANCMHMKPK